MRYTRTFTKVIHGYEQIEAENMKDAEVLINLGDCDTFENKEEYSEIGEIILEEWKWIQ